jgi:hypothetical protein
MGAVGEARSDFQVQLDACRARVDRQANSSAAKGGVVGFLVWGGTWIWNRAIQGALDSSEAVMLLRRRVPVPAQAAIAAGAPAAVMWFSADGYDACTDPNRA